MLRITKIRPLFNRILVTADRFTEDQARSSGIIDPSMRSGSLKPWQRVLAAGGMVRDIVPGDMVMIDPKRYAVMRHNEGSLKNGVVSDNPVVGYDIPMVDVDGKECLMLYDSDVMYAFEGGETSGSARIIRVESPPVIT